ncbi:unnamed protein product [Phytophthora lilii]|uniref:Unnamed protein product n=1 Tax=Phytophthora lilii TaxID=2077276 RepID=A0A9W6WRE4_9STRA|nr:unnamed protein product [Phytophthora lilii]
MMQALRLLKLTPQFAPTDKPINIMGGGDVGSLLATTLRQIGTNLSSEDLVKHTRRSLKAKEGDAPIVLEDCKYFDLFNAAHPVKVRHQIEQQREEARSEHGAQYVNQILWSSKHHPLKKNAEHRLPP